MQAGVRKVWVIGLVAAFLLLPAAALASPESLGSSNPSVTLDVAPDDGNNLPSSANLTATGAGFGAAHTGSLFECTIDHLECTSAIGLFTTTTSGDFTAPVTVTRSFTPFFDGSPIDCGYIACMLDAETDTGSTTAGHHLSFYVSGSTPPGSTPGPTPGTTPIGQRAAALERCKKKHSHPARRKCKRKARKLPI
jgi:neocarzinostatin family protein